MIYTVKNGDTLWGVAKAELGSASKYADIVRANKLKTSILYEGQQLMLPEKGE